MLQHLYLLLNLDCLKHTLVKLNLSLEFDYYSYYFCINMLILILNSSRLKMEALGGKRPAVS